MSDHWHQILERLEGILAMAPGVVVSDTTVQIGRALLIGAIGWAAYELVTTKSELRSMQVQHALIVTQLGRMEGVLMTGTDDRWRKRDHDAYAQQIDARLDALQSRIEAQGRLLSITLERNTKPQSKGTQQ